VTPLVLSCDREGGGGGGGALFATDSDMARATGCRGPLMTCSARLDDVDDVTVFTASSCANLDSTDRGGGGGGAARLGVMSKLGGRAMSWPRDSFLVGGLGAASLADVPSALALVVRD
jgi:hypothetical protein